MLILTRRISDDEDGEAVNIHVSYRNCPALIRMLSNHGIDPAKLDYLHDTITIKPLRISNPTGKEEEVMLGFMAPRHIDIVRSEIDYDSRNRR